MVKRVINEWDEVLGLAQDETRKLIVNDIETRESHNSPAIKRKWVVINQTLTRKCK